MAATVLTPVQGQLANAANVTIFTAFTESVGKCRARCRFHNNDTVQHTLTVGHNMGAAGDKPLSRATVLPNSPPFEIDFLMDAAGDEILAWEDDAGNNFDFEIDGIDTLD